MDPLVPLEDDRATDPGLTGHKAAALAVLLQTGHRVPAGIVVPVPLVAALGEAGAEAGLPTEVRAELERVLVTLGGVVAVRTSGLVEDLPDASWAGQYESVLGVRTPTELWKAIDSCVASASSHRVQIYGDGAGPAAMAVLVQAQVRAETAGVAFTANPVTGDDEVLVNAVRGLGDRMAAGEVTPESWVRRPGSVPERTDGPDGVLTVEAATQVADEAARLAAVFGGPVDMEWAFADGDLHVLQARPITALPIRPDLELPTEGTWEKDTSHYTDLISPIGGSLYLAPMDAAIAEMARTYGLLIDGAENRILGGESYTRIIPPGGKDGPAPPWWLMGVLLRVVPIMRARLKIARRVLAEDLPGQMLRRWTTHFRPELQTRIAELRAVDLPALDAAALRTHLDAVCRLAADGQRIHFLLFIPYCMALRELCTTAAELLGWDEPESLELVGGLSTTSSAPTRDLHALAALAHDEPSVASVVAGWSGQTWDQTLADLREAGSDMLADRLQAHMHEFGCRTTGYDSGQPSIAERPELVLGILRDLVAAGTSADQLESDLARRRAEADARLQAAADRRGLSAADRDRIASVVARARVAWPVREDNLFWTDSMVSGVMRLAVLEVGRRLTEAGHLRRPEDACWLDGEELLAAAGGRHDDVGDLAGLVSRRKAEYAWVAAHPGPTVIGPAPSPPPSLRAAPEAIQRTSGAILWAISHEYPGERSPVPGDVGGVPGAPGTYTGPVRVVLSDTEFDRVQAGDVLVCPITTPVWSVLFSRVGALITDAGGVLSHAAIVAREHNVPAVLGTVNGTTELHDGQIVTVDGTTGTVTIHEPTGART